MGLGCRDLIRFRVQGFEFRACDPDIGGVEGRRAEGLRVWLERFVWTLGWDEVVSGLRCVCFVPLVLLNCCCGGRCWQCWWCEARAHHAAGAAAIAFVYVFWLVLKMVVSLL